MRKFCWDRHSRVQNSRALVFPSPVSHEFGEGIRQQIISGDENGFLAHIIGCDNQIRHFFIDARILLCGQPRENIQPLVDYVKNNFVPELISKYQHLFSCTMSRDFKIALEKTLIAALYDKKFQSEFTLNNAQKKIIKLVRSHCSSSAAYLILAADKKISIDFANKVGFFTSTSARRIFYTRWRILEKYLQLRFNPWARYAVVMIIGGLAAYYTENLSLVESGMVGIIGVMMLSKYFYSGLKARVSLSEFLNSEGVGLLYQSLCEVNYIIPINEQFKKEEKHDKGFTSEKSKVKPLHLDFVVEEALEQKSQSAFFKEPSAKKQKRMQRRQPIAQQEPSNNNVVKIVDYSEVLGYPAQFNPTDPSSMVHQIRGSLLRTVATINPELKDEIATYEWKKFQTQIRQLKFVGSTGSGARLIGRYLIPNTKQYSLIYELKVGGKQGDTRILGNVIESKKEKKIRLIEFNTYCPSAHQGQHLEQAIERVLQRAMRRILDGNNKCINNHTNDERKLVNFR